MNKLFFWNDWYRADRRIFLFFLTVSLLSLVWLIYAMVTGVDNVIHWDVIGNLERLKTTVYEIRVGNLDLDIPLDNFVIFQYFSGSNLTVHPVYAYVYLFFLVLSMNLVMAILPDINKFWFYAGMGLFIGYMVLFNMGQVSLFNQNDKSALIIILSLYLTAGYYFREFNPGVPVFKRFLVFNAIAVLIGLIFYFYAGVDRPFLYLANQGIYAPVILSVLFILSVAHEIIYGFLYLATARSAAGSRYSLIHFILISLIYMLYVVLTYLYYTRQIHWEMVYLNPFLILVVTTVIGLWSFRKREDLYREIFSFYPSGALFYLGFACITFITVAYIFSTGNDPLIEAFEDTILYSQIGFSIMFFIYVIANFGPMISRNYRVIKVVYQSRVLPFFVFRLGGLVAAGFLFFQAEFFPYYQLIAGYYNEVGDLYLIGGQLDLAREYYEKASDFEYQNHRSNYAMATIGRLQRDKLDEAYYFENSLLKKPTDYAYVNLSNIFLRNNQYFEGLFKLKEGKEVFPYSAQILNNLGYFYSRTDITDTAFYYFNLADNATRKHDVPEGNIYALLARSGLETYLDSLEQTYDSESRVADINRQAILNQLHRYDSVLIDRDNDTIRNDIDFAAFYNSGFNVLFSGDTAYFSGIINAARKSGNTFYQNRMDMLKVVFDYLTHRTGNAFRVLTNNAMSTLQNHEYYSMLGKFCMGLGKSNLAADYFKSADIRGVPEDRFYLGLALAEAGRSTEAITVLKELRSSEDPDIAALAAEYVSVLEFDNNKDIGSQGDEFIYLLSHYHPHYRKDSIHRQLIDLVASPGIRDLMNLEFLESLVNREQIETAAQMYAGIDLSSVTPGLKPDFRRIGYMLDVHLKQEEHFIKNAGTLPVNDKNYLWDVLLQAVRQLDGGDTTGLDDRFRIVGTWDPFFETGIIKSADYFSKVRKDDFYAYNLLINATETNMNSVPLYRRMIDLSIDMGLTEYALDGLEVLRDLVTPEEYAVYREEVMSEIRSRHAGDWER